MGHQPFRFLDLPPELRCRVYESIEFPTTWHVLDRVHSHIDKRDWPVPPKSQVYDSRVTLIRPHTPLEILMTCHLVSEEAGSILKRKMEHCKIQPLRYLVDYSAAYALVRDSSALRNCLGMADGSFGRRQNRTVRDFLEMCTLHLSQTRRGKNGPQSLRAIEMTINHKSEVAYGMEVLETMLWLRELRYYGPTRLVVIYKSPLPGTQMLGDTQIRDSGYDEGMLLQEMPRESENGGETNPGRGVFVRPLEQEAFNKHVEGLEWY